MSAQSILSAFREQWANLPAQRSKQWFDDRMFSVGASVMGVLAQTKDYFGNIISTNKYQTLKHLIREKCELEPITDYTALNWGCVMEPVCCAFASAVFECEIFEMGAIPNVECALQRCSPDGVAVVEKMGDKIVSFEFKAPIGRIPTDKVPLYYKVQVMACLCAVEPAELGIFVDVVIRNCAIQDWHFDSAKYNESCFEYIFPNGEKKKPIKFKTDNIEALIVGYIFQNDVSENLVQIEPINYGECDGETFKKLMDDCARTKVLRCEFSPIVMRGYDVPKIEVPPGAIGFIPLKIMFAKIIPIEKKCGFVREYTKLIEAIIDIVRDVIVLPIDERSKKIDELYVSKNIKALQDDIPLCL